MRDLLGLGVVVSCDIVVPEILRGAKNKKDFDELHDSFLSLPRIPIDEKVVEIASRWGFEMNRKGKIVSTTDLIIASAAYKNAKLLHIDSDFKVIASFYDLEEETMNL